MNYHFGTSMSQDEAEYRLGLIGIDRITPHPATKKSCKLEYCQFAARHWPRVADRSRRRKKLVINR